jgi:Ca2+-binding EF-hand superfamily protein
MLKRKYKDVNADQWKTRKINLKEFIDLFNLATGYLRVKPTEVDLTEVFKILDTDIDGFITFKEYVDFIRKYLGMGLTAPTPNPEIIEAEP